MLNSIPISRLLTMGRCFQLGEGPSRSVLCGCEIFDKGLLRALLDTALELEYSTATDLSIGEDLAVHLTPAHEDLAGEDCDAGEDAANVHAGHTPPLLGMNY